MKLIFKQRIFSWLDKFDIFNEDGEVIYRIEGRMSFGRKLIIFDKDNREVAVIEKALLTWLPRYNLFMDGIEIGAIKKELSFFKPKFIVEYNGWEVNGDFWDWNYEISCEESTIAQISKEFLRMSDVYTIDVLDEQNCLEAVLVVLAIDAIKDDSTSSSN